MKIMLISPRLENIQSEHPPLGLAYIASSLELDNHEVLIEDMNGMGITTKQMLSHATVFKPNVVGINVLTSYVVVANEIAIQLKNILDTKVIVGGSHPSSLPEQTLLNYSGFDIAVKGEGEITMRELCKVIEEDGDFHSVKGISFREKNKIITTPPRSLIENIDTIPFPAWHLLQMDGYFKYTQTNFDVEDRKTFSVFSSRGCPGKCKFCDTKSVWSRKYRARNATNVVDEIEKLYNNYGVRFIYFADDMFVVNKNRILDICNQIKERKLDIKWKCFGRVDFIDEEILQKMKSSGCVKIYYGIESGSQKILDYINKNITIEQAEHAIRLTNKVGILVGAFWMIGFPPETEEDVRRTIEFNKRLPLDDHETFSILAPFPGSELYEITKNDGLLLSEDWEMYYSRGLDVLPVIRTQYLSNKDLYRLKNEGDREFLIATRQHMVKYYMLNPHKLFDRIVKNHKLLFSAAFELTKNKFLRFKNENRYNCTSKGT